MFNPSAMIQQMIRTNPMAAQAWQAAQRMSNGKNNEQRLTIAKNLAKQKGMTLDELRELAKQYNITIPDETGK